jgi:hypothetical protein
MFINYICKLAYPKLKVKINENISVGCFRNEYFVTKILLEMGTSNAFFLGKTDN